MPVKKRINPFYVLLVVVGVAFFVTASAYGMMAVREFRAPVGETPDSGLLDFLNRHGAATLAVEIAVLAVMTFAAMGYDQYVERRDKQTLRRSADSLSRRL